MCLSCKRNSDYVPVCAGSCCYGTAILSLEIWVTELLYTQELRCLVRCCVNWTADMKKPVAEPQWRVFMSWHNVGHLNLWLIYRCRSTARLRVDWHRYDQSASFPLESLSGTPVWALHKHAQLLVTVSRSQTSRSSKYSCKVIIRSCKRLILCI